MAKAAGNAGVAGGAGRAGRAGTGGTSAGGSGSRRGCDLWLRRRTGGRCHSGRCFGSHGHRAVSIDKFQGGQGLERRHVTTRCRQHLACLLDGPRGQLASLRDAAGDVGAMASARSRTSSAGDESDAATIFATGLADSAVASVFGGVMRSPDFLAPLRLGASLARSRAASPAVECPQVFLLDRRKTTAADGRLPGVDLVGQIQVPAKSGPAKMLPGHDDQYHQHHGFPGKAATRSAFIGLRGADVCASS